MLASASTTPRAEVSAFARVGEGRGVVGRLREGVREGKLHQQCAEPIFIPYVNRDYPHNLLPAPHYHGRRTRVHHLTVQRGARYSPLCPPAHPYECSAVRIIHHHRLDQDQLSFAGLGASRPAFPQFLIIPRDATVPTPIGTSRRPPMLRNTPAARGLTEGLRRM